MLLGCRAQAGPDGRVVDGGVEKGERRPADLDWSVGYVVSASRSWRRCPRGSQSASVRLNTRGDGASHPRRHDRPSPASTIAAIRAHQLLEVFLPLLGFLALLFESIFEIRQAPTQDGVAFHFTADRNTII